MARTIGKAFMRLLWISLFVTVFITMQQRHQRAQPTWGPTNMVRG